MHLLSRKLYRLLSFSFVILLVYTSKEFTLIILGTFLALLFILEYLRFKYQAVNEKIFRWFSSILKTEEKTHLSSTTVYFISMFLIVLFFPYHISIAALCFLIFPDTASAVVGYYLGKIKLVKEKTLEGSLAFFSTCLITGSILKCFNFPFSWIAIFSSSFLASVVELIPYMDDNISVPFVVAGVLKLFRLRGG